MKIPGPDPKPIFGNFYDLVKEGAPYYELRIMKEFGRIVGFFEGSEPIILTTDINFMKCMLIRDFNSFVDRRVSTFLKLYHQSIRILSISLF